jgi:hypothetical protein
MRHFGPNSLHCALGHILGELAHYNWTPIPYDGDCASIKIGASMFCVAGYMSDHCFAVVREHYSRKAPMRDTPAHAGPIVLAVKIGCSARPASGGERKRIRKAKLWLRCWRKSHASNG